MFSYLANFVSLSSLGLCDFISFRFIGVWLLQSRKTLFSTNSINSLFHLLLVS